jgi:hypothetical protein
MVIAYIDRVNLTPLIAGDRERTFGLDKTQQG